MCTSSFTSVCWRLALALILAAALPQGGQAQAYQSAIGLRLGYPASVSYKHFLSSTAALEGFVGFRNSRDDWSWTNLGLAYQVHGPLRNAPALRWYYGIGGSLYFWRYRDRGRFSEYGRSTLGIQGYLGLDLKIPNAPLNFSLDWTPTIFLNGYLSGFAPDYGALSIRYTIN